MIYSLLKPLLFRLDAERAHDLVTRLLSIAGQTPLALQIVRVLCAYDDPVLAVECAGLRCPNPVGLAAGFDKRGVLVAPMAALGFGHLEIGTVTPRPQAGNPRPRLFRLPEDRALINRFGFNSPGMVAVAHQLRMQMAGQREADAADRSLRISRACAPVPIGVNIGKNRTTPLERAVEDYVAAFMALAPLADYVAVNISSPNTPALRQLHERAALEELLGALSAINRRLKAPRPLFLKVSPDETPARLDAAVQAACQAGIAGFIASNTTLAREGLRGAARREAGGLSGAPLAERVRRTITHLYRATDGRLPVIGVGGVASAADAYAHVRAGAAMVQLYTGLIYAGPGLVREIKRGLAQLVRHDGYCSISEAVGKG